MTDESRVAELRVEERLLDLGYLSIWVIEQRGGQHDSG
jgi:hypothetical protein